VLGWPVGQGGTVERIQILRRKAFVYVTSCHLQASVFCGGQIWRWVAIRDGGEILPQGVQNAGEHSGMPARLTVLRFFSGVGNAGASAMAKGHRLVLGEMRARGFQLQ